jgi:hypothetical protein
MIHNEMNIQRRKPSWLADEIHCPYKYIFKIYNKTSIDFALLQQISEVLHINFFRHYADQYDDEHPIA